MTRLWQEGERCRRVQVAGQSRDHSVSVAESRSQKSDKPQEMHEHRLLCSEVKLLCLPSDRGTFASFAGLAASLSAELSDRYERQVNWKSTKLLSTPSSTSSRSHSALPLSTKAKQMCQHH